MIAAWFVSLSPIVQALIGTCFTWLLTALGAASYWSLLAPAIEMAEAQGGLPAWFPAVGGFLLGGVFLWAADKILPHVHPEMAKNETEGLSTTWRRSVLLVLAITLHNFPEGLAVSVPLRREKLSRLKSWCPRASGRNTATWPPSAPCWASPS